jgi:hypothetical protein
MEMVISHNISIKIAGFPIVWLEGHPLYGKLIFTVCELEMAQSK